MSAELLSELENALESIPGLHLRRPLLSLIQQSVRRHQLILTQHPTALFQSLWNDLFESTGCANWSPDSASDVKPTDCARTWLQSCREQKFRSIPDGPWLRLIGASHSPPEWDESLLVTGSILQVTLSADERFLCAVSMLHEFVVCETRSNAILARLDVDAMLGNPSVIAFSPDGRYLACGTHDGELIVIDWPAGLVVLHDHGFEKGRKSGIQQAWFAADSSRVTFLDRHGRWEISLHKAPVAPGQPTSTAPASRGIYRNSGQEFWSFGFRRYNNEWGSKDDSGEYGVYCINDLTGERRDVVRIEGCSGRANLVVSPDGSQFAWCESSQLRVYESHSGSLLWTLDVPPAEGKAWWYFGHGEFGKPGDLSPVWSADSKYLAVVICSSQGDLTHSDRQIWVVDVATSEVTWRIPVHGKYATMKSVALFSGGGRLAHDARGCHLLTRQTPNAERFAGICDWDDQVVSHALSKDGHIAAMANRHGNIFLLQPDSRQSLSTFRADNPRKVEYLQLSADGAQVAWWQPDGVRRDLWIADAKTLHTQNVTDGVPGALQFSHRGDLLVSVGRKLKCIHTRSVEQQYEFRLPYAGSATYQLDSTSRWLAAASQQTCVWRLDINSRVPQLLASDERSDPLGFDLSPDGRRIVVRAERVDAAGRFLTGRLDSTNEHMEWIDEKVDKLLSQGAWGPGDQYLTFARRPGILRMVNAGTHEIVAEARVSTAEMFHLAVSDDGRWIAGAALDGSVRLVDLQQGGTVSGLNGFAKAVDFVQFDSGGRRLLGLGDDGDRASSRVKLWDLQTQQVVYEIGHSTGILAAALSADGNRVAASCGDEVLRVWEVGVPEPAWSVPVPDRGPNPFIAALVWSPGGSVLAHSAKDGEVIERDAQSGAELCRWGLPAAGIRGLRYAPDGRSIFACGNSPCVHLHEALTGRRCSLLRGHVAPVTRIRFSPHGEQCATFSDDGEILLWNTQSGHLILRQRVASDRGFTRLAFLTNDQIVFLESKHGVTAWNLRTGEFLESCTSCRTQMTATVNGFCPISHTSQAGIELRCRRTSQAIAWLETSSLEVQHSADGGRWALLEMGRLRFFDLYFGEHRFEGSHPRLEFDAP